MTQGDGRAHGRDPRYAGSRPQRQSGKAACRIQTGALRTPSAPDITAGMSGTSRRLSRAARAAPRATADASWAGAHPALVEHDPPDGAGRGLEVVGRHHDG